MNMLNTPQRTKPSPQDHIQLTQPIIKIQDIQWQAQSRKLCQSLIPQQRDPTQKQLCQCIIMIKDRFPMCKLDKVIQLLHDTLLRQENKEKRFWIDQEMYNDGSSQLQKKRMHLDYAMKFQDSDANPRFYQESTPNRYNNVVTTIVRLSYRKLQYFIINHLNPQLKMIDRQDLKMIKTPLVNCRNWMTDIQAQNFHRFVKLTYKLSTQQPMLQVVMELHNAIIQQLKKRNVTYKRHNRRGEEYSGWTEEMEGKLVGVYCRIGEISSVMGELIAQYPQHRACFQHTKLRTKIDRMVRTAVRKLLTQRQKYGFTSTLNINDYMTNKIVRSAAALSVRKCLLSFYLDKDVNAVKLREVGKVVLAYLDISRLDVEEVADSSCEVVMKEEVGVKIREEEGDRGKKEEE